MKDTIRVLTIRPGHPAIAMWMTNTLKSFQNFVEGYIETAPFISPESGLVVICNEEGRLLGMEESLRIYDQQFVGPVIIAGVDGEEFTDIPDGFELLFSGPAEEEEE